MAEKLVPTKRTTPTKEDFAAALLQVWPDATKEQAGVLYAHFAGETGDGAFCWNWNLGNVKRVRGDGFDFVSLKGVWEGFKIGDEDGDGDVDGDDRVMLIARMVRTGLWIEDPSKDHAAAVGPGKVSLIATEGNPATWFKAYPDLPTAMRAFVRMKRAENSRYFSAWAFVVAGDPDGYARELGRKGYYTASADRYAAALLKKYGQWLASDAFEKASPKETTSGADIATNGETVPTYGLSEPSSIVHPLRYEVGPSQNTA